MLDLAIAVSWAIVIGTAIAIVGDFILVVKGLKTISMRTWIAENTHPLLRMAGALFSCGVVAFLWHGDYVIVAYVWGWESCHLLTGTPESGE